MTDLTTTTTRADFEALAAYTQAGSTRRVYRTMLDQFSAYVGDRAPTYGEMAGWLVALDKAGKSTSTLSVAKAALISIWPECAHPLSITLGAIRRRRAARGTGEERSPGVSTNAPSPKDAFDKTTLARACENASHRDRAILLMLFWGAFRRSELAALRAEDVEFSEHGMTVLVRKSKTDQFGEGFSKPIARRMDDLCPVAALRAHMNEAGITTGPLFPGRNGSLDGQTIALIVKRACEAAGIEGDYSGHSGRSGFVTLAKCRKVTDDVIMRVTGHQSPATLMRYDRRNNDDILKRLEDM